MLARIVATDVFLFRTSLLEPGPEATAALSLEGRRLVRAIATKLQLDEAPNFDRIVTSPLPSAVMSAELFAERVDYVGVVEVLAGLTGRVPANVVAKDLLGAGQTILIVADEPQLSQLGAHLAGRPTFPPPMRAQLSVLRDGKPLYALRAGEPTRSLLVLA